MSIVKDVDYNFDREIAVGNQTLRFKGALVAPHGFNPRPFLDNVESAINSLSSQDPQGKLEFDAILCTDKFTITADKPNKSRKKYQFTVEVDVSDAKGFERQGAVYALAQTIADKPCELKIIEKPKEKPAASPKGAKKAAEPRPEKPAGPIKLENIVPEDYLRLLNKSGIKTYHEVLAFGNNAEKLSETVTGLATDDARTIIELVQVAIFRDANKNGKPIAAVKTITDHWVKALQAVNLNTAEAIVCLGAEGLLKLKIPQLDRTQAKSIVSACDNAVDGGSGSDKDKLPEDF